MKSLQDAVYNWLTIKVVLDNRPDDSAAAETEKMFRDILHNEHSLTEISVSEDAAMYYVNGKQNGRLRSYRFPRELIEIMLNQIKREPEKFQNYPRA